ncbi:MAG: IS200/IS605 family transposase [Planctomycetaceae bacterium]|nr:IS200/IS605 family transposase [Planctomycetaceae bacterium]
MGHTYSNLTCHIVFSTKHRRADLTLDILPRLIEYAGGIIRNRDGKLLAINGASDHMHILVILAPKHAISDQVRDIKAGMSKWIHDNIASLRTFAWQEGYAIFSVSKSVMQTVIDYISSQTEHHHKMTFEEELVALLQKHGIDYDPRYVFD